MRDGTDIAEPAAEMLGEREQGVLAGTILLDARELAERMGYRGKRGARTVREKVAAGLLPCVRLGKDLRFHWPTVIQKLGVTATLFGHLLNTAALFF